MNYAAMPEIAIAIGIGIGIEKMVLGHEKLDVYRLASGGILRLHAVQRWNAPPYRMFWWLLMLWTKRKAGGEKTNWIAWLPCSTDSAAGVIRSERAQLCIKA